MTASVAESESVERGFRRLSSIFQPPVLNSNKCHRCGDAVYHAEKIGPVQHGLYHRRCFRCIACDQHLTMKTYYTSQVSPDDREVYCSNHYPRVGAARLDQGAIGIKGAVSAQENFKRMSKKLDGQIRKPGTVRIPSYDANAIAIKRILTSPKAQEYTEAVNRDVHKIGLGPDAMGIKQPVAAQKMHTKYQHENARHQFQPKYKKRLVEAQVKLEHQLRREEDEMFKVFQMEREDEKRKLTDEIKKEWEVKLKELTEMYEKNMAKKKKKVPDEERKIMTMQFENQKKELEKSIVIKREKKKESMTLRLKEREQKMTSDLVQKQSQQMLDLLAAKKEELKRDLEKELEAQPPPMEDTNENLEVVKEIIETMEVLDQTKTTELPGPHPPRCRKADIYTDPQVFDNLDENVIQVAQNEQMTYTDLVHELTDKLLTELEKVRAIFRWITVKDLNVIEFAESLEVDTPMGLLRGIKFGTETYHVLFMRLCSYAGLHCVEIKGHSKSVGYEPGMKIQPEMFQNTWNAVLIDGDWRLVQCNWGARHLVLNKDRRKDKKNEDAEKENKDDRSSKSKDKIRYQYDEHYFLTDPDEFIQEFWPMEKEWQLLEAPITLEEFEALPFVRSVFFHYGMQFDRPMQSVLDTSERGGTDIKIRIPEKYENDLVFYYQLRFADAERKLEATYRGANLERFVFQTMIDNMAMFSVHVPTTAEYFLEIFANKIDENNRVGAGENASSISPFRLKCACKFKIRCTDLKGKMHPLPDCASGEWGPKKAIRHFNIIPLYKTHSDASSDAGSTGSGNDAPENPKAGILNVDDTIDLKFKLPMPLQFVAKLRMNHVEKKALDAFVHHRVDGDILTVTATMPQLGQYGLDLYAKPLHAIEVRTLSHACKYLLNAVRVSNPVELPKTDRSFARRGTFGPASSFDEMGIKTLTHPDHKINVDEKQHNLTIELEVPEDIEVSYQMMREPDDDCKEIVHMTKDYKKVKFDIHFKKHGNYLLCLYARRLKGDDPSMPNVFNYLISHKKKNPLISETNGNANYPVKFEEKKSGGLLRKSLFGGKKDKSKDKDKKH